MKSFHIEFNQSDDTPEVIVVSVSGAMGHGAIKKTRQIFDQILNGDKFFIVVDMSEVESVSSAAIGELMGCRT